ncbi:hypothetical protein [Streptomyces sp. NPDC006510]|uniref:hypothetical protein n=1 Tax=Streptomyces sp. NPDC006510 TaxID=3155600 RepID=UPI0033B875C2
MEQQSHSLPHPATGPSGGMGATPSEHTCLSLGARLDEQARTAWLQLKQLHVRHRGAFA